VEENMLKNQKKKNISIDAAIASLLAPIQRAVKLGQWDGADGAKQYVESGQLTVLEKRHGKKFKKHALSALFENILKITESTLENQVIEKFAFTHPDIVTQFYQDNPDSIEKYPYAVKSCSYGLQSNVKKRRKKA
jgi:hypothetical protein